MYEITLAEFLAKFDILPPNMTREEWMTYKVKFGHPWDPDGGDVDGDMDFLDVCYDPELKQVIISIKTGK